ncbi:MAG: hypothetical protein JRE28_11945 [Deltaproteobacteria bacterium]|nr:hypothetical protein [Deltaproteobacteria bacterium]
MLILLSVSCGDKQETAPPLPAPEHSDSFTFFDIGENTIISGKVRKGLNKILGDDAIEPRNIIDLEINYKGFLKKYFTDLDKLNKKLNSPLGERVEHNTVKLIYRYMQNKNVSFDYVELVYSEYTRRPVLIKIHFQKDVLNTIETLKQKYGAPESIKWGGETSKSLYWKKSNDLMILSFVPDQFGKPKCQIIIYFKNALEKLIKNEQKEKKKTRRERTKSGKNAF